MIWVAIFLFIVAVPILALSKKWSVWPGFGIGVLGLGFVIWSILVAIPAGHVGVQTLFGKVQDGAFSEGLNLKNPFIFVRELSVRTQTYTMVSVQGEGAVENPDAITALSSDGMRMPVDVSVLFRLVGDDAPWVYQNLGLRYVDKVIRPAARTAVREGVAQFTSQEAYATKREELAVRMQELLSHRVRLLLDQYKYNGKGFIIQQVLLRNVDLPQRVKTAIEAKLEAQQDAIKMTFILEKEHKEAERKEIEAGGIKKFQDIVREGIDEQLLRWKGIEATRELASSPNSKVIIIGGKDGMPLILNSPK